MSNLDPSNEVALEQLLQSLDQLLACRFDQPLELETESETMNAIVEKLNQLSANIKEMNEFANALARGKINLDTPSRRNYLASYLKELHSQLSSLTFKAKLLKAGQMVSKLDYTGELYDAFNALVERVAEASTQNDDANTNAPGWEWSVNSWRYHQLLAALNHLHIMIVEVDRNGKVVYANLPAKENLGTVEHLGPDHIKDQSNILLTNLAKNSTENNSFPIFREVYDNLDGSWYKITSDQVQFPDGQKGYLHVVDDISEWKKNERKLRHSATVDALTGSYNRKAGMQALEKLLTHGKPEEEHCAAFVDIDNLKKINDGFGHKEGDYTIVSIASVLMSSVRDSDTVSRYGGDEFLVVFKGCTLDAAEKVVSRMYSKLAALNEQNGKPYTLSFSYGITSFHPNPQAVVMDVVEDIDAKMYKFKTERKKRQAAMQQETPS